MDKAEPEYDWDAENTVHLARHGITRQEAEQVFQNDPLLKGHQVVEGEDRWAAAGVTNSLRVLVLVFTVREERIWPITGWDADKRSTREYFAARGT